MKRNRSILTGLIILGLGLLAFAQHLDNHDKMIEKLEHIFSSDRIKITIPHHGGYAAAHFGDAVLEIKRHSKDSLFSVLYKDAIDKRKLAFLINKKEYQSLKQQFIKLISIHNTNKSLSGDCLTIDKNYLLRSKQDVLIIKPDKNADDFDCLDHWIYSKELNN